jgi:hypothetical protein
LSSSSSPPPTRQCHTPHHVTDHVTDLPTDLGRYEVVAHHDDVYDELEHAAQNTLPTTSFMFNDVDADEEMLVITPRPKKPRKVVTWAPETWAMPSAVSMPVGGSTPAVYEA